jgi:hypothetical protein
MTIRKRNFSVNLMGTDAESSNYVAPVRNTSTSSLRLEGSRSLRRRRTRHIFHYYHYRRCRRYDIVHIPYTKHGHVLQYIVQSDEVYAVHNILMLSFDVIFVCANASVDKEV